MHVCKGYTARLPGKECAFAWVANLCTDQAYNVHPSGLQCTSLRTTLHIRQDYNVRGGAMRGGQLYTG
eukprot:1739738-Rhodomonas_salina.2